MVTGSGAGQSPGGARDARSMHSSNSSGCGTTQARVGRAQPALLFVTVLAALPAAATTRSFPGAAPCNTTLQACINGSGSGDTINIGTGTYTVPEISVGKVLTLNGTGVSLVTLQADGVHRVLNTAQSLAGGVTLKNLTISGGSCVSTQTGGGIFADTGTPLILDSVDVKNNTCAGNSGGGIFASADATLTDANVVSNTAPGGAGAGLRASGNVTITRGRFESNVSFNPGGAMRVNGTLTMTDVIVLTNSNTAAGTNGGGIRADGGLTLTGGTVDGNTSANLGGGVFATNATISGATFQNNSARQGGGIYVSGTLAVTDSAFDSNEATLGSGGALYIAGGGLSTLTGSSGASKTSLNNNSASVSGGGIFAAGDLQLVGETSFTGNKANGGDGGAIDASGSVTDASGNSVLLKETFASNTASGSGGAIAATGAVNLLNSPAFTSNIAGGGTAGDGGAVWAGGDVFLSRGSSVGNKARNGGVVYSSASVTFNVHDTGPNSMSAANIASTDGGCAYAGADVIYNSADARNCNATGRGGAAFAIGKVTLSANGVGVFSSNVAGGDGGLAYGAQIVISDAPTVSFNSAGGSGGAALSTGTMSISNASLANNSASAFGGAVSAAGALTVTGSDFSSNIGPSGGGAIRSSAALDVATTTFSANLATGTGADGGAIRSGGAPATLTDVVLIGNTSARLGGAVRASSVTIERATFAGNISGSEGGAITLGSDSDIRSSRFIGNQSSLSGAISAQFADTTHVLNVQDSLFVDNLTTTTSRAADMRVFDLDLVLLNNTFARPGIADVSVQIFRCVVAATNNIFSGYSSSLQIGDLTNTTVSEDYNDFFNSPFSPQVVSGGHSIAGDPLFANAAGGNFRPAIASPVIDAGNNSVLPGDLATDLDGLPRREDVASAPDTGVGPAPVVDMGAYEFHGLIFKDGFEPSM